MPEYIVKTHAISVHGPNVASYSGPATSVKNLSRSLVIKADYYVPRSGGYDFYVKDDENKSIILVASVPEGSVLDIVKTRDAFQADFLDDLGPFDDESDDVCLDCRFLEFLESEDFFNAVWDVLDAWHYEESEDEAPAPKETIQ